MQVRIQEMSSKLEGWQKPSSEAEKSIFEKETKIQIEELTSVTARIDRLSSHFEKTGTLKPDFAKENSQNPSKQTQKA